MVNTSGGLAASGGKNFSAISEPKNA